MEAGGWTMQRTTLMLDLEPRQIATLLAFTRHVSRADVLRILGEDADADALLDALEEFHWQLAASGNHEAIELMARYGGKGQGC
jgi:hypothetical protein